MKKTLLFLAWGIMVLTTLFAHAQPNPSTANPDVARLKREAAQRVEENARLGQEINDMLFSFAELGFQEVETAAYLTKLLAKEGFTIQRGIANMPTAWMATWGSGKPVIALGSDVDCIPRASQKPGVAYHDPLVEGAPGHGEGHNSGQALNIISALAVKKIMAREKLPGTLVLWPGVAEELLGAKAYLVRDGYFKDVDACIFTHVASNLGVSYGDNGDNGLVSVKFQFEGQAAHAAGSPWRGRSALDAVELMNVGWNYRREHLELTQRSHYVIPDGGDQPNVVPSKASVWYFLRDRTYPKIRNLFDIAVKMAEGAALMTDTKFTYELLGSAWPGHFNQPIAETMYENIKAVGLPAWDASDQLLAKATQLELEASQIRGLATKLDTIGLPADRPVPSMGGKIMRSMGGSSDDIADVSWTVPTVVLRYPANIPGLPGHHWANAISMATPIAHKGVVAGARVEAMTIIDLLMKPELLKKAWAYYRDEQTKDIRYAPLVGPKDSPATYLNRETMARFKPALEQYYYQPAKYKTYLEQLGIAYPTIKDAQRKKINEMETNGKLKP